LILQSQCVYPASLLARTASSFIVSCVHDMRLFLALSETRFVLRPRLAKQTILIDPRIKSVLALSPITSKLVLC
jgi:hypothetical protein